MAQTRRVSGVATKIMDIGGRTVVSYHDTHVISWNSQDIILNSGGYRTATTKLRMNQASNQFGLGIHVFQEDHEWFVSYRTDHTLDPDLTPGEVQRKVVPFEDFMVIPRKPTTT